MPQIDPRAECTITREIIHNVVLRVQGSQAWGSVAIWDVALKLLNDFFFIYTK